MNSSIVVRNRKTGERVSFDVPHYVKTGEIIITSTKMLNTEDNCYVSMEMPIQEEGDGTAKWYRESLNAKN
jgi:hypothetical protein